MATKSKAKSTKATAKKAGAKDLRPAKTSQVKGGGISFGPESLEGGRRSNF